MRVITTLLDDIGAEYLYSSGQCGSKTGRPDRFAIGVVARMVHVLPVGDQARFRQGYMAELLAMTEERASARDQIGHALRAAMTMWSLRRALRAPRPRKKPVR